MSRASKRAFEPRSEGLRDAHRPAFRRLSGWWLAVDRPLLFFCLSLLACGVALVGAIASAQEKSSGLPVGYFAVRQGVYAGFAALVLTVVSATPRRWIRGLAASLTVLTIALMAAVPFFGHAIGGSRRWIDLHAALMQPSNLAMPALLVVTAWLLHAGGRWSSWAALGLYGVATALLLLEPDRGAALLLTLALGAMLLAMGARLLWLAFGALALGLGVAVLMAYHPGHPISGFLQPAHDSGYAATRAVDAVRRGGWFGSGSVKAGMVNPLTDYIYAAAIERLGLIAGVLLALLLGAAITRGLFSASRLERGFTQTAAAGLVILLGLQSVLALGVNLNLLPSKPAPLPLVSYGVATLVGPALAMGMALSLLRTGDRPAPRAASS